MSFLSRFKICLNEKYPASSSKWQIKWGQEVLRTTPKIKCWKTLVV